MASTRLIFYQVGTRFSKRLPRMDDEPLWPRVMYSFPMFQVVMTAVVAVARTGASGVGRYGSAGGVYGGYGGYGFVDGHHGVAKGVHGGKYKAYAVPYKPPKKVKPTYKLVLRPALKQVLRPVLQPVYKVIDYFSLSKVRKETMTFLFFPVTSRRSVHVRCTDEIGVFCQ